MKRWHSVYNPLLAHVPFRQFPSNTIFRDNIESNTHDMRSTCSPTVRMSRGGWPRDADYTWSLSSASASARIFRLEDAATIHVRVSRGTSTSKRKDVASPRGHGCRESPCQNPISTMLKTSAGVPHDVQGHANRQWTGLADSFTAPMMACLFDVAVKGLDGLL